MTLEQFLYLAAALFSVGLYGALSQQAILMVMMGLELMVNAVIVAGAAFWYFVSPTRPDGQVVVLVALILMAVDMAAGFAVTTAIFRQREINLTNSASSLKG